MGRYLLFIGFFIPALSIAQSEARALGADGNKLYGQDLFANAEQAYLDALTLEPEDFRTNYNLGNAYYRQEKYEDAARQFNRGVELAGTDQERFDANHNLGNALLEQDKYKESIEAYKNALRINPDDEETRYNLAYAQQKMDDSGEDQNDSEDENDSQDEQQPENQLSEDDARRLLDAMKAAESDVEKAEEEEQGVGEGGEKDW